MTSWRRIAMIGVLGAPLTFAVGGAEEGEPERAEVAVAAEQERTVLSRTFTVDRKYRSMKGPSDRQRLTLLEGGEPELLWITGYRAVMVGADGESPQPQEFMCHSNLDIDMTGHRKAFGVNPAFNSRLFTLSQGQFEIDFPEGFGIPIISSETLDLTTQVLNLNLEKPEAEVRHKVTVEFVRDGQLSHPMKAVFPTSAYGLALVEGEDGYFGIAAPDEEKHGPGCLPAEPASAHTYSDNFGRRFTGHWVVKPGREVNRTLVTGLMRVPYETTIHYIAVHLHPFAESLELRDLTEDRTLFKSKARNYEDKIGLAHVDYFASVEGIPVRTDHEYELVSTYNNTTEEEQDSMAVMYLYLHDPSFDKNAVEIVSAGAPSR